MQQWFSILRGGEVLAMPSAPDLRKAYSLLLLTCGTLLTVFGLTILLARALRRYRQAHLTPPRKPTPHSDVWKQHRLPEGWDKPIEPDEPPKDT